MVGEGAAKAKVMFALALDRGNDACELSVLDGAVYGIDAVGSGTPLEVVLVVDVCSCEELQVSWQD